jgi:hypothetical protein
VIVATIAHAGRRRRWPIAILALCGALAAAACNSTPSPSPSASPAVPATSSPAASTGAPSPSAVAACAAADLRATGGPWGGAAGSRGSDIVVENQASVACLLPAAPTVGLLDAGGTVLLSTQAEAGSGPSLAPGGTAGFSVLFGNWCDQEARLPLHFRLALAAAAVDIGNLFVTSVDELPPCNGPGQPASLSATDWQP